ncbi:hypothetical protein ACFLSJ_07250 [Verrucomicrobiota bacterium]
MSFFNRASGSLGLNSVHRAVAGTALAAALAATVQAANGETFQDTFDTDHDYLTQGVAGTIWDAFVFNAGIMATQNTVVSVADANISNAGKLTLRSDLGQWEKLRGDDGILLYRMVSGDFTVQIDVTDVEDVYCNDGALMVRNPSTASGENFLATRHYEHFLNGIRNTVDGVTTNIDMPLYDMKPVLRIRREGSLFHFGRKDYADATFETLNGSPVLRPDMPDSVQVGIWQGTFECGYGAGTIQFDNFLLETAETELWADATDLGDGWRYSAWLGYFNTDSGLWIYHTEHGWMYTAGASSTSIWFYTPDMEWLWSGENTYPYLYRHSDQSWLWYMEGTTGPRQFANLNTGLWEQH